MLRARTAVRAQPSAWRHASTRVPPPRFTFPACTVFYAHAALSPVPCTNPPCCDLTALPAPFGPHHPTNTRFAPPRRTTCVQHDCSLRLRPCLLLAPALRWLLHSATHALLAMAPHQTPAPLPAGRRSRPPPQGSARRRRPAAGGAALLGLPRLHCPPPGACLGHCRGGGAEILGGLLCFTSSRQGCTSSPTCQPKAAGRGAHSQRIRSICTQPEPLAAFGLTALLAPASTVLSPRPSSAQWLPSRG